MNRPLITAAVVLAAASGLLVARWQERPKGETHSTKLWAVIPVRAHFYAEMEFLSNESTAPMLLPSPTPVFRFRTPTGILATRPAPSVLTGLKMRENGILEGDCAWSLTKSQMKIS